MGNQKGRCAIVMVKLRITSFKIVKKTENKLNHLKLKRKSIIIWWEKKIF